MRYLYRLIGTIAKCILFEQNKVIVVSKDSKTNQSTYNQIIKYTPKEVIEKADENDSVIEFTNGSKIECICTDKSNRGKRANIRPYYDWSDLSTSYLSQKDLDEILEPYIKKNIEEQDFDSKPFIVEIVERFLLEKGNKTMK